jgi:hypothetical protein
MQNLTIDTFVRGAVDFERAQYEILGRLQIVRSAFAQNIIFPHLAHLVSLHGSLEQILKQSGGIRGAARGQITGIDTESQTVIVDEAHVEDRHLAAVEDLIHWALPRLKATMDEGSTICEFVEDHLQLEEVGIMPAYVNEGYLIIPDAVFGLSHVLRYEMSLYQSSEEQFRALRTTLIRTISHERIRPSPSVLKLQLLKEHREFPNPATFAFDSSIEFPYEATTLPLAKRKLMRHLYARRGLA